jgi:hypothetical protein
MRRIFLLVLSFVFLRGAGWAQLAAGDVAVVAYNTDGTDAFAWLALRDMPVGTTIHFTSSSVSNGWFRWGDHLGRTVGPGPLTWTSTNLVRAGTVVSWISGTPKCWSVGVISGGTPALNSSGDQIFAYTGSVSSNAAGSSPWWGDPGTAKMLYGLNFANAGWDNVTGGGLSTSYVPAGLSVEAGTAVHAGTNRNAFYAGIFSGSAAEILVAISNSSNWVSSVTSLDPEQWPAEFKVKAAGTFLIVQ